jgi:hypothetical protein
MDALILKRRRKPTCHQWSGLGRDLNIDRSSAFEIGLWVLFEAVDGRRKGADATLLLILDFKARLP